MDVYQDAVDAVELALGMLGCSQKELAGKLKVSPTQVSKWKQGDYMSSEMEDRIKQLTKIGDHRPAVVLWAGSVEGAGKWEGLFRELADMADESSETGYETYPLQDEMDLLSWSTVRVLTEMGITRPRNFPKELVNEAGAVDWDLVHTNPYTDLIYRIYKSLTDVYGFYIAYVDELIRDNDELLNTDADNIEPCLIELAASKVEEIDDKFAPKFSDFRYKVRKQYTEWLTLVKDKSFRAGVPLRAELMDMINSGHDSLGHTAEAEALGFNSSRLHPDIYMNELLEGMRAIHQVLPAIMKRLGIYREFKLDASDLRNDASAPSSPVNRDILTGRSAWPRRRVLRRMSAPVTRSIGARIAKTAGV